MLVFFKYKYNVKTCMYTISPLYQIINFNVSTWYLKPLNIKWDRLYIYVYILKCSINILTCHLDVALVKI